MKRRPFAAAILWTLVAASAGAQGEPEQRAAPAPQTFVGAEYSYASYQGDIDSWHTGAISVGRRRASGSFIARLNLARRFATNGAQIEADAYPTLGEKSFAYLNAGYSGSQVFPEWRFGAELFRRLPHAFEASAGFRQLRFGGEPVTLFTGSVGQYSGNHWLSLRPYLRDKDGGLSASASLVLRRYYVDADNWVGGRIGYGSSPTDDLVLSQLTRTSTMSAGLNASRSTSPRAVTTWSIGFEREELQASRFRNRWDFGVGVTLRY